MIWVFCILGIIGMGAIALVAAGRGEPMVEAYDDRPDALVPADGDLEGRDLRRVRFSLAFRGYRMSEVDALLSRLADQLETDRSWQPAGPSDPAIVMEPVEPVARPGAGLSPYAPLPKDLPALPDAGAPAAERLEDDTPPE